MFDLCGDTPQVGVNYLSLDLYRAYLWPKLLRVGPSFAHLELPVVGVRFHK
jgi:hypothetical protein